MVLTPHHALAISAQPGPSMEALLPPLKSTDINERMLAASSVLTRSEKAAIPVLIAALDSKDLLVNRFCSRFLCGCPNKGSPQMGLASDPYDHSWVFVRSRDCSFSVVPFAEGEELK